ncbi:MAG: hypothetical protein KF858_11320 [Candidatus Sumerlaeia bacterium]|nr:hypothetical protein [Candidatus Sumerlaeia bacterium]
MNRSLLRAFPALVILFAAVAALAQESNPPVVSHIPPAQPVEFPRDSLRLEATITDESALLATPIYWRVRNGAETVYSTAGMTAAAGSLFFHDIPGTDITASGLEYYIEARDEWNNVGRAGTPQNPLVLDTLFVPPAIELSVETLNRSVVQGSNLASETFTVRNTGRGTLSYTVTDTAAWLSVSPSSGTSTGEADTLTITYATQALAPGNYFASISVIDANASNSPQTIAVLLAVTTPPPTLVLSRTTIDVTAEQGQSIADQTFTVASSGQALGYTIASSAAWLSVQPVSGTATTSPATITVSFDSTGLSPGQHTANITVNSPQTGNSPRTIAVTLTLSYAGHPNLLARYTFDESMEDWYFQIATPTFQPPFQTFEPGFLVLAANDDNDRTYGHFTSEDGFAMVAFDPMADSAQTGQLWQRQGHHYLMRFHVRRATADRHRSPTLRIRANSRNYESYHTFIMPAYNDASGIPDIYESTPIDFLIQPHPHMYTEAQVDRTYLLSFDIINADMDPDRDVEARNGGFLLDRVEVFLVPLADIQTLAPVKTWDFETVAQFNQWQFLTYAAYEDPVATTGGGALQARITNPAGAFGNWQNLPGTLAADLRGQTGALFLRMRAHLRADEPSGYKVPQQRIRLMPEDFTTISETGVLDIASATFVPRLGHDRYVYTYLAVPEKARDTVLPLHAAWDLLSFESFDLMNPAVLFETSDQPVYLDELKVDLIRVQNYPDSVP